MKIKAKAVIVTLFASVLLSISSYQVYLFISGHNKLIKEHEKIQNKNKIYLNEINILKDDIDSLDKKINKKDSLLKDLNDESSKKDKLINDLKKEKKQLEKDLLAKKEANKQKAEEEADWSQFMATYYDANYQSTGKSPGDPGYGKTATGKHVEEGVTIAVDPNVIPLGSWVLIKYPDGSLEKRRADDTGSAIVGNKVDIYIPSASYTSGKHPVQLKVL